jgi:hypothetical protein
VLDGLRGGQETGVQRLSALVFGHDLLAFVEDALDRVALLAARGLTDQLEHLLQPLDLAFGLVLMLLERGGQLLRLRSLGHLGQRLQDLLLGIIDVLERIEE